MIVKANSTEKRNISISISTGTKIETGNEYIYCELSYYDRNAGKHYNKVFPASKYDKVVNLFCLLSDERINPVEVFG